MKKPNPPTNIEVAESVNTPENLAAASRLLADEEQVRRLVDFIFSVDWEPC